MALGLISSPLQMIFSLLLMQGISLTMFRSFLNQAINRADPLRFSLNFGNQNNTTQGSNSATTVPTPAPIVDPRMLDLLTLIRALTPANSGGNGAGAASGGISGTNSIQAAASSSHVSPIMSSPIIALPTISASPQPAQQTNLGANVPHIIIVTQLMKTAASQPVQSVIEPSNNRNDDVDDVDDDDNNNDDSQSKKSVPKVVPIYEYQQPKVNKSKRKSKSSKNVVVFDAVGYRHPNHNYDSVGSNVDV